MTRIALQPAGLDHEIRILPIKLRLVLREDAWKAHRRSGFPSLFPNEHGGPIPAFPARTAACMHALVPRSVSFKLQRPKSCRSSTRVERLARIRRSEIGLGLSSGLGQPG